MADLKRFSRAQKIHEAEAFVLHTGTQVRYAAKSWRYVEKRMLKNTMIALAVVLLVMQVSNAATETIPTYTTENATEIYAVIFGITVGLDEEIKDIRMAKVIDPITGSMEAMDISVSEIYIKSAKQLIEKKPYKAKIQNGVPVEVFTYFYYDPKNPEAVITEITK